MLLNVIDEHGNTGRYQVHDCVFKHLSYVKNLKTGVGDEDATEVDVILPKHFTLRDVQELADISVHRMLGRITNMEFTINIFNIRTAYLLEFLGVNFSVHFSTSHRAHWMKMNDSFGLYTAPQRVPEPRPEPTSPILEVTGPHYVQRGHYAGQDDDRSYNSNYCYYKIIPIFSLSDWSYCKLENTANVHFYLQLSSLEEYLAYAFRQREDFNWMISQKNSEDEYHRLCGIAYELYDRYVRKMSYYVPGDLEKLKPQWTDQPFLQYVQYF
jgi:hypothetical protein